MILRHMTDIDETLKLTLSQGHILQQSTFGSMKMCICDKQARLTYLRGVNVLVSSYFLSEMTVGKTVKKKHFLENILCLENCCNKDIYAS